MTGIAGRRADPMKLLSLPVSMMIAAALLARSPALAGTLEGNVRIGGGAGKPGTFVVWVADIKGQFSSPKEIAVMDQRSLEFVPHVLAVQAGTTVEFPNSDPLAHNVFSISPAKRFNLGLYQHGTRQVTFDRSGVVEVLCNVHLEMSAFIVVLENPYFARTAADGSYRIARVPSGRHRVRCWQERSAEIEREVNIPETGVARLDFP
jgi:plastocyanin